MLNVDDPYRSSSQAFILSLFADTHGKGSSVGRGGGTDRWGQEHVSLCARWCDQQPSLLGLMALMGGGVCAALWVAGSGDSVHVFVISHDGKSRERKPRLSRDSYDRYISLTELLTYTMERQDIAVPLREVVLSLAKNVPSIAIGERLAADKLRLTVCRSSRENPQARNSSRDHRSDCAPVSAMADTLASMPGP